MRSQSRSPRRRRLSVAVLSVAAGVLALSGCGADLRPGIAAELTPQSADGSEPDTTTITQGHVDDLTEALCSYLDRSNAASQDPQELPVAYVRSNVALSNLIYIELMDDLAAERGLTMRPSDIEAAASQTPLPDGLSSGDEDLLKAFFYDYSTAVLQQSTVAANIDDSSKTTSEGVTYGATSRSDPVVNDYFKAAEVDVNPADGTWDGRRVQPASGSLSDPVSSVATAAEGAVANNDVANLPDPQVCG